MNKKFYQHIFEKKQTVEPVPPNEIIASWTLRLIHLLYPEKSENGPASADAMTGRLPDNASTTVRPKGSGSTFGWQ